MAEKAVKTSPKPSSKVFDVAKPGKSMASSTARPVIVANRPIMQDPMMSAGAEGNAPAATPVPSRLTIKPLLSDDTEDEKITVHQKETAPSQDPPPLPRDTADEKSDEPVVETPDTTEQPEGAETPAEDASSEASDETASSEDASGEAPDLLVKDKKEAAALEEAAKKQEELDKLTESRQYFLPINAVERRRSKVLTISTILCALLFGLVLVNFLLDAEILKINGVRALTDLFGA